MYDYVKLRLDNPNVELIEQSKYLDFIGDLSHSTGQVYEEKRVATFHFCKVTIYKSGSVYFDGSIHKMWNSINGVDAPNRKYGVIYKGYNGNLFTLENVKRCIKILCELLFCKPQQLVIQNLEVGVNIELDFGPEIFIRNLLMHMGAGFETRFAYNYSRVDHERYYYKIYNKGKQYGMSTLTMRLELGIKKSEEMRGWGLKTLRDVNLMTMRKCQEALLKRFDEVLYYDETIRKKELSKRNLKSLKDLSNSRYWLHDLSSNRRYRPKKKLEAIIENHSNNLKVIIAQKTQEKCVIINQESETVECVIINHSSKGLIITQPGPRICPVSGYDISMQKNGSFLLSNTGLKYLEKNAPDDYLKLVEVLLTGNPNKYERTEYAKLSKQIRNRYNNTRETRQSQLRLF